MGSHILSHERDRDTSPINEENYELGLTRSTSHISSTLVRRRRTASRSRVTSPTSATFLADVSISSSMSNPVSPAGNAYYPVPTDDTYRIGAGGLLLLPNPSALQGLSGIPDLGPEDYYSVEGASRTKFRPPPQGEKTCFGLLNLPSSSPESKWSTIQPYRFAVEFWYLDKLLEKERAYSETHFYAGSWFNVYVQTLRKKDKGVQLGIYLHRQNPGEPFPTPSMPRDVYREKGMEGSVVTKPSVRTISMPVVAIGSPPRSGGVEQRDAAKEMEEPYRDPRRITKVRLSPDRRRVDVWWHE